jgi:CHAT domain-containing protein/Flp pilus assembly protein TadD
MIPDGKITVAFLYLTVTNWFLKKDKYFDKIFPCIIVRVYILAILLFFISLPSISQTWKELTDSLSIYYNQGDFEKAAASGEKAIVAAKKEFGELNDAYAGSLHNLAMAYDKLGNLEYAETLYKEALEIRKKVLGENNLAFAGSLTSLGLFYYYSGQYQKAEPLFLQAVEIKKKVLGETHLDYVASLEHLAILYDMMSQHVKAESLYRQVMEIRKKVQGETHPIYAGTLTNLAALYENMGLYEKAESMYLQAKAILKNVFGKGRSAYADCLDNLGTLYYIMGQYAKVEPLYKMAMLIRIRELGKNTREYATSLGNLAVLYDNLGQYAKAEPLYSLSMDIRKKVLGEDHPEYAAVLNNLAVLFDRLGQHAKAETLYVQAMTARRKVLGENHIDYANSLSNLAAFYVDFGQYEKAGPLCLQAMEIKKKALGEFHPDYAVSLDNLAQLYDKMGQFSKVEPLFTQATEIRRKVLGVNHPDYANSLSNLAFLYDKMGQYEKAEPLFLQAMEIHKKMLGEASPGYMRSLNNLALLYYNMGQYEKAESYYLLSSQVIMENLKSSFTILSEKEKGNYVNNNISSMALNNSFIYNYRKGSSTLIRNNFNQLLFFKSLTLTDTRNLLNSILQNPDTAIQRLFNDWEENKSLLAKQYALPVPNRRIDLKQIETRVEEAEKELSRRSAIFAKKQKAISVSLQDVQQNLQPGEVAIEFVSFRLYNKKWTDSTIYAAYILKQNESLPIFVPLFEEKQLQQLFDKAGKTSTKMVNSFYRGADITNDDKRTEKLGQDLYRLVWQPLEPYLKGVKKISYSPAGKLFSIAFQALPVDSTTVLMDKYQLQQYSSTRQVALRSSENETIKPIGITLFGDARFTIDSLQLVSQKKRNHEKENVSTSTYTIQKSRSSENNTWGNLPGTATEVKTIQQLFEQNKINTQSFVQKDASEENLKALNGHSPQILHIATHGFFLPEPDKKKEKIGFDQGNTYTLADDPLTRSGLVFAGANYAWSGRIPIEGLEDGIATAYEISQLNLNNTELVVLSACETALGDVQGSEGVFGLQRAFKIAGAKKLIVSLWQVPDKETAELMSTFYTHWMKGETVNDAFTQAQADMRKKYAPFYWAAFVLVE